MLQFTVIWSVVEIVAENLLDEGLHASRQTRTQFLWRQILLNLGDVVDDEGVIEVFTFQPRHFALHKERDQVREGEQVVSPRQSHMLEGILACEQEISTKW